MQMYVEDPALPGLADQRDVQQREVLGKDRDDVEAHHSVRESSSSPGGGSMTTRPPATSTSGTSARTKGTRASGRPDRVITSRSWAECSISLTVPTGSPARVCTESPTSSWSRNSSGSAGGGS